MTLAILEPRGNGLSRDELRWMPPLIQGAMTGDFNLYSAMTVTDRQNLETIFAEQDLSMSGLFSDEDFVRIGHLVNAHYVVTGSITRTATVFMLEFAVTSVETGVRRASTRPTPVSLQDLENLSAVREATADLLGQLGVNLTAHGRRELTRPLDIPVLQAQTALAWGITAQQQGLEVEAMSYFLQASGRTPELAEATNRLETLTAGLVNTSLGMDDYQYAIWRGQWMERLQETEDLFASQTQRQPYFLVYDLDSITRGTMNRRDGTVDLGFWMSLVPDPVWADTINQMIYTVAAVLMATGRAGAWDLNWPNNSLSDSSPFDDMTNYITAVVEIVNEHGVSIGSQSITIPAGFNVQSGVSRNVVPKHWEGNVVLQSVDANLVTDNLGVQVASVNDDAGRTAVSVMSNAELYQTFGIRSVPAETPNFTVRGDDMRMLSDPARFWSIGVASGVFPNHLVGLDYLGISTFVGTFQATLAPWPHSFIRIGCDLTHPFFFVDVSYWSDIWWISPFIHYALFLPFEGGWSGGWYIGTGFRYFIFIHRLLNDHFSVALDFTTGFMLGWFSISYTLGFPFFTRWEGFYAHTPSHKLAIGLNIRLRSRETR